MYDQYLTNYILHMKQHFFVHLIKKKNIFWLSLYCTHFKINTTTFKMMHKCLKEIKVVEHKPRFDLFLTHALLCIISLIKQLLRLKLCVT